MGNHDTGPVVDRPTTDDLTSLIAGMTTPVTTMFRSLSEGAVRVVEALIEQAWQAGLSEGRRAAADAGPDWVTRMVGVRHTEAGTPGVLVRCSECGGRGLLHRPDPPPRSGWDQSAAATVVLPKIRDGGERPTP